MLRQLLMANADDVQPGDYWRFAWDMNTAVWREADRMPPPEGCTVWIARPVEPPDQGRPA